MKIKNKSEVFEYREQITTPHLSGVHKNSIFKYKTVELCAKCAEPIINVLKEKK